MKQKTAEKSAVFPVLQGFLYLFHCLAYQHHIDHKADDQQDDGEKIAGEVHRRLPETIFHQIKPKSKIMVAA